MTCAFLPLLVGRADAVVMNVSSAPAFVSLPATPTAEECLDDPGSPVRGPRWQGTRRGASEVRPRRGKRHLRRRSGPAVRVRSKGLGGVDGGAVISAVYEEELRCIDDGWRMARHAIHVK